MNVHEFIIASTIMEMDRERKEEKRRAQERAREAKIRQRERADKEIEDLKRFWGMI